MEAGFGVKGMRVRILTPLNIYHAPSINLKIGDLGTIVEVAAQHVGAQSDVIFVHPDKWKTLGRNTDRPLCASLSSDDVEVVLD